MTTNSNASTDPSTDPDASHPTPLAVWPCGPLQQCPSHDPAHQTGPGHTAQGYNPDPRHGPGPGLGDPPCAGQLPDRLLYRAVGAFSEPGDLVLIAHDPRGAATAAALDFGRHAITATPDPAARRRLAGIAERHQHDARDQLTIAASPSTWRLPPHHPGAALLLIPTPCPDLLRPVTPGPHPATRARDADDPGAGLDPTVRWQLQVLARSLTLLRPGGLILMITSGGQREGQLVDRVGQLSRHATHAGLGYLQHLIGICADLHGGRLHAPARHPDGSGPGRARHQVVHTDLLLFAATQEPCVSEPPAAGDC